MNNINAFDMIPLVIALLIFFCSLKNWIKEQKYKFSYAMCLIYVVLYSISQIKWIIQKLSEQIPQMDVYYWQVTEILGMVSILYLIKNLNQKE